MAQIMNFKRIEVLGETKADALAKAPFGIQGNATPAFKNWKAKQKSITDADIKQFMLDYLAKNSKNLPGVGFYITLEAAVANSRKRPYVITDIKNQGQRRKAKVFQLIDTATNQVVAETKAVEVPTIDKDTKEQAVDKEGNPKTHFEVATKSQAKELARELYTKKGFKGNLKCRVTDQVVKGESIVFTVDYTPSTSTQTGRYLVFGIENA
jgi:hypothetical protein